MISQPIPLGIVTPVPLDLLILDKKNPRISVSSDDNDIDIIKKLIKESDLMEILSSIAANGYLDIEPMIGMQEGPRYVVLEGNRRLAALKLFNYPELAQDCGIILPEVRTEYRASLSSNIKIYRVNSREEARAFIGFKHINGPHRWGSFAKGKYATLWYKEGRSRGITVQDIAKKIGDSHDTIRKMIKAYLVIEQAEKNEIFSIEDRYVSNFSFSHLYTALTRSQYCEYLGLDDNWRRAEPEDEPVPREKLENLGKLLRWLYGSKADNKQPIIQSQNPDLRQLGAVLVNQQALVRLESGESLKSAYLETIPTADKFANDLSSAIKFTDSALTTVAFYGGGYLQLGERLSRNAEMIYNHMKSIEKK